MAFRLEFFDLWRAGYAGASVAVYEANSDTLADLFYDEALSEAAPNPVTLLSLTRDGVHYGKFARPIYTSGSVEITVNSTDETGIIRPPLTTLDGEDGSELEVTPTGATIATALDDLMARFIDVRDYGVFLPTSDPGYSASTNSATLAAAIAAAATVSGGEVLVPAGTYAFNTFSNATGVLVRGRGRAVTILQSAQGSTCVTMSGDRAGFANLTLDGVSKQPSSIGIYAKAKNELRLYDVCIKRFETGLHQKGAQRNDFKDLYIDACTTGAKFHGDLDTGNGSDGDTFWLNRWTGGLVSTCTTTGVELSYEDKLCLHNSFEDVGFEDSTGTALKLNGARFTDLDDCWFDGNTTDLVIQDDTDSVIDGSNQVLGFHMAGGQIDGAMTLSGMCEDVVFERVDFASGTYTLNAPENVIVTVDCTEDSSVTLAGTDTTKWARKRTILGDYPGVFGLTTNGTATDAYTYEMAPGEIAHLEAVVVAKGRNVTDYAIYHIARSARRPGSTLLYDTQSANFTVGDIITGGSTGASARITADADGGATGTLTLIDIIGEFTDDELITGALGGSAACNGVMAHQNAALLGALTSIEAAVESDASWDALFAVSADEVKITVQGAAAKTVEWTVSVKVTSTG